MKNFIFFLLTILYLSVGLKISHRTNQIRPNTLIKNNNRIRLSNPTALSSTVDTKVLEQLNTEQLIPSPPPVNYDSQYELSPQQFIYVVLSSIFVTCLIIADVIGVKLFEIPLPFEILGHKTVEHTCGMLTFPITFLLGDIING